MKKILGITVLLAVVVLGVALIVSCGAEEDTSITFVNQTAVTIRVTTDAGNASLPKMSNSLSTPAEVTVTGKGSITITGFQISDGLSINDSNWTDYIGFSTTASLAKKQKPTVGLKFDSSGYFIFTPRDTDDNGDTIVGNNAWPPSSSIKQAE